MKAIKRNTTILLMILWASSCVNIQPRPQCDISFIKDRCRCRCYEYDQFKTVKQNKCDKKKLEKGDHSRLYEYYSGESKPYKFQAGNHPIELCEGLSGAFLPELARYLLPKAKENIQACEDK